MRFSQPQPPLIPHFLFNRLTLSSIEAATAIGGTKLAGTPSALLGELAFDCALILHSGRLTVCLIAAVYSQ